MRCARVAESVDARDLKSLAFRGVPVQVWPRAPFRKIQVLKSKIIEARVAESVDARDLKSLAFRGVPVQVWPRAPFR